MKEITTFNENMAIEDLAHEMGFDITFHLDGSYTIKRDGYGPKSFLDANDLREELVSIGRGSPVVGVAALSARFEIAERNNDGAEMALIESELIIESEKIQALLDRVRLAAHRLK